MKFKNVKMNGYEVDLPVCVDFRKERILDRMQEVYDLKIERDWETKEGEVYV